MATGTITTARGKALNIDELIAQGNKPLGAAEKSTRQTSNYTPEQSAGGGVRGFVPMAGKASAATLAEADKVEPTKAPKEKIASSVTDDGEARSMNDVTGVKVTKPSKRTTTAKAAATTESSSDDEELGELVGKLEGKKDAKK